MKSFIVRFIFLTQITTGMALAETPLFLAVGEAEVPPGVGALSEWPVVLDASSLRSADSINLNIPTYAQVVARESVELRGNGGYRWHGEVDGVFDVLLTSDGTYLHGRINSPTGDYAIRPYAGGHLLIKVDASSFPPPGEPVDPDMKKLTGAGASTKNAPPLPAQPALVSEYPFLDVMILYTPQARDGAGGDAQMRNFAQHQIDLHNLVVGNSLANSFTFRLRHVGLISAPDPADSQAMLFGLQGSPLVTEMRADYGIDTVMLVLETFTNPPSGQAFAQRYPHGPDFAPLAVGVVLRHWADIGYTIPHEGGHILGMEHDPDNAPPPSIASFPWSYGHKADPFNHQDSGFRTVMSYDGNCGNPCVQVPMYSNTYYQIMHPPYHGEFLGIPDERENARTAVVIGPSNAQFYPETDAILLSNFDDKFEITLIP